MTIGAFLQAHDYRKIVFKQPGSSSNCRKANCPNRRHLCSVFFVLMGVQVDITLFTDIKVLGVGLLMTLVAALGKIGAAIFLPKASINNCWMGMIPRARLHNFMSIGN